jgi:hypothetical protein
VELTVETFAPEIQAALAAYDRYVVALDKVPEEAVASLNSLMSKAITAYTTRNSGMRHGIALDRHLTIILSVNDESERPLCGVYFNLHSPYTRKGSSKREPAKA